MAEPDLSTLTKAERAEYHKKKLATAPLPPKEKKPQQQQKKTGAGGDDSVPSSTDSVLSSGGGDGTPVVAKAKATGKLSTGSLAGRLQADDAKAVRTAAKKSLVKREEAFRKITWLAHLPQYAGAPLTR